MASSELKSCTSLGITQRRNFKHRREVDTEVWSILRLLKKVASGSHFR